MYKQLLLITLCCSLFSCQKPEARRPVQQRTGSFIQQSVERNIELNEIEEEQIKAYIKKDSNATYFSSANGFWYTYLRKDSLDNPTPVFGDTVTFTYSVSTLDGTLIVSEEQNGIQNYIVDKTNQELTSGIREGIKLMKAGEKISFLFPSHKAYGYYGIQNKLGSNIPVKNTITLQTIKKQTEN